MRCILFVLAEDTITPTETSAATTLEAATTSKAPAGELIYVLSASGGSLNGAQPQGNGRSGTFIAFDPTALSGSTPRKFTIDSRTLKLKPTSVHTTIRLPWLQAHRSLSTVRLAPLANAKHRNI
ncbi:hypothetical protein SNK03_004015 [Fusarium graminearum]